MELKLKILYIELHQNEHNLLIFPMIVKSSGKFMNYKAKISKGSLFSCGRPAIFHARGDRVTKQGRFVVSKVSRI